MKLKSLADEERSSELSNGVRFLFDIKEEQNFQVGDIDEI